LAATPAVAVTDTLSSPQDARPLRSQARVLRLWTKPWEDMDGDLYDQGYVYVQVSTGQWLIDHVQRQIRDAYAPLRPPPRTATGASGGDATPGSGSPAEPSTPARAVFSNGQFPAAGAPAGTSFNRTP
jgi:conjugal transfer pilus assembly protein TraV